MMDCCENCEGIKCGEDLIRCLTKHGARAFDLHKAYGARISGLMADALDILTKDEVDEPSKT